MVIVGFHVRAWPGYFERSMSVAVKGLEPKCLHSAAVCRIPWGGWSCKSCNLWLNCKGWLVSYRLTFAVASFLSILFVVSENQVTIDGRTQLATLSSMTLSRVFHLRQRSRQENKRGVGLYGRANTVDSKSCHNDTHMRSGVAGSQVTSCAIVAVHREPMTSRSGSKSHCWSQYVKLGIIEV